jgi:hypothetical protein
MRSGPKACKANDDDDDDDDDDCYMRCIRKITLIITSIKLINLYFTSINI